MPAYAELVQFIIKRIFVICVFWLVHTHEFMSPYNNETGLRGVALVTAIILLCRYGPTAGNPSHYPASRSPFIGDSLSMPRVSKKRANFNLSKSLFFEVFLVLFHPVFRKIFCFDTLFLTLVNHFIPIGPEFLLVLDAFLV